MQYYKKHSSYNSTYANWNIYGLYSDNVGWFRKFYAVSTDDRRVYGTSPSEIVDEIIKADYYKSK